VIAACGSSSSGTKTSSGGGTANTTSNSGKVIAYNVGDSADPFFVAMEVGADAAVKGTGYSLSWQGNPTTYSPATQIPILSQQFAQKPAGLIIAPTDPNALQAGVDQFIKAGIPVVNVDTHVGNLSNVLAYITGDNQLGGKDAADAMAKAMKYTSGSTYQVAVGMTSSTSTTDVARLAGFKQEIAAKYPGIKIVSVAYSQSDSTTANQNVSEWLTKYSDLKGIFAIDGTNGTGASSALESRNLVGKIALVGYDAYPDNVGLLKQGVFSALIAQNPTQEAKLAVGDIVKYLKTHSKAGIQHNVTLPNIVLTPKSSAATLEQYTYPEP
jgi:ABC-type sugar transport system substrate-binding protein